MLKHHYVEIGMLCDSAPPHSLWVQRHCRQYKSKVSWQFVRRNVGADHKQNS